MVLWERHIQMLLKRYLICPGPGPHRQFLSWSLSVEGIKIMLKKPRLNSDMKVTIQTGMKQLRTPGLKYLIIAPATILITNLQLQH